MGASVGATSDQEWGHVPVMVEEVLLYLAPRSGGLYIDATVGLGGHTQAILSRSAPDGRVLAIDADAQALAIAERRLSDDGGRVTFVQGRHRDLERIAVAQGFSGCQGILLDLGVSSLQLDDAERGFSFREAGPLDMRMDRRLKRTGAQLLATMDKRELSQALWELSDEPDHEKIAEFIVNQRQVLPIERTEDLVRLIFAAKNTTETAWRKQARFADLHPAARTFQALRIMVNDELGSLRALLRQAPSLLSPGGRLGIISFHSGEDRLVKLAFREGYAGGIWSATSVNVIRPTPSEVHSNPRSSSAKFRWAVKA